MTSRNRRFISFSAKSQKHGKLVFLFQDLQQKIEELGVGTFIQVGTSGNKEVDFERQFWLNIIYGVVIIV